MIAERTLIDHVYDATLSGLRRWRAPRTRAAPSPAATVAPAPQPRQPSPQPAAHPVIRALKAAGRPLTNVELARAIGCSPGHTSRLRRQVEAHLRTWREGRHLYAALA